jgi:CO/xanthine dehydrogenase FAD-binding subunit
MTAVGPKVLRAEKAEQALEGKMPKASVLDNAAGLAAKASLPRNDLNASENYRRNVLKELVKEAISASYDRAIRVGG